MNNPNPFIPQGSVLEQNKRRSRMKLAVFCVLAIGVCSLTAMLIQGCKREQENPPMTPVEPSTSMMDTNLQPSAMNVAPVATNVAPVAPVTPVVPAVPEVPASSEYTVIKGDTLAKIAKAHGVKLKALQDANAGVVPIKLKIGQKLTIPASGSVAPSAAGTPAAPEMGGGMGAGGETYSVKSGDTLTKIAKAHGTTVKAIQKENNLSTTRITVGKKLKIPAKAELATPASAPAPAETPAPATPAVAPVATPAPAGKPAGQ